MTETLTADELAERLAEAVVDAFVDYTTENQNAREDLYALTMSGLGACSRQGAYRLAKTPPSEPLRFAPMREANIGTMMHEGLLPRMAKGLGGAEEIPVELSVNGLTIKGRTDLYALRTVADLKTVGTYKFSMINETVPRHRIQVAGYGLGLIQSGKPVDWIAWIYVDRSSGAEHIIVEPWTDELVALVEDRIEALRVYAENPDAAPRDERGPGLSIICDSCPWLRTCWGEDAAPGEVGAQRILAKDNAGVAEALRLYDKARAAEKEARDDKAFARAMFADREPGAYEGWTFGWSAGSSDGGEDKDAAVALLKAAGIPVPMKPKSKRLLVRRSRT